MTDILPGQSVISTQSPSRVGISRQERRARLDARFLSLLVPMRREWHSRLRTLSRLPPSRRHHAVRQLLRSRHLYPLFAFEALRACNRLIGANEETLNALADQFNPFNPVRSERVVLRDASRSTYKTRTVCDFGPIRRMHQQVVDHILRNLHPPLENQFLFNGGMPMALRAIEAAVSAGNHYFCELDFVGFYGSVVIDDLAELMRPLPASVTSHVVWDEYLRSNHGLFVSRPSPTPEPPSGLFLGSALSPIVGEILIARTLADARLTGVMTYADNVCVFGRSEREVCARINRLRDAIAASPLGCVSGLRFDHQQIRNVIDQQPSVAGIEFSSHRAITSESETPEQYTVQGWQPTFDKIAEYQISASDYVTVDDLNTAITKVSNWRRYYSTWPEGDLYEAEYLASLKARRFLKAQTPEHRASAISAVVTAHLMHQTGDEDHLRLRDFLPGFGTHAEERLAQDIIERIAMIVATRFRQRQRPRTI